MLTIAAAGARANQAAPIVTHPAAGNVRFIMNRMTIKQDADK